MLEYPTTKERQEEWEQYQRDKKMNKWMMVFLIIFNVCVISVFFDFGVKDRAAMMNQVYGGLDKYQGFVKENK